MNHATIKGAGPSHIELIVVAEAPDLRRSEAIRRWLKLGNTLLDTEGDGLIAVHQLDRVVYEETEAAEGELVWGCDFCGAYAKNKIVVERHERTCDLNPNQSGADHGVTRCQ